MKASMVKALVWATASISAGVVAGIKSYKLIRHGYNVPTCDAEDYTEEEIEDELFSDLD